MTNQYDKHEFWIIWDKEDKDYVYYRIEPCELKDDVIPKK